VEQVLLQGKAEENCLRKKERSFGVIQGKKELSKEGRVQGWDKK